MRLLLAAVLVGTSVVILGAQVYRGRHLLQAYDWRLHWGAAGVALAFYSLALLIAAAVWASMLAQFGVSLPVTTHFRYLCLTNLAKRLPGTIWYVIGRSQFYAQHGVPAQTTSVASGMELGVSAVAGVLVCLAFSIPIMGRYGVSPWWLIAVFAVSLILVQPAIVAWVLGRLGISAGRVSYRSLLVWIAAHGAVWVLGGCMLFAIASIFAAMDLSALTFVIGSWSLVGVLSMLLFFSPSNLGLTEVGLSLLLSSYVLGPLAVVIALAARIIMILFELFWAAVSLSVSHLHNELKRAKPPVP